MPPKSSNSDPISDFALRYFRPNECTRNCKQGMRNAVVIKHNPDLVSLLF